LWAFSSGHSDTWQTIIFTTLTLGQMGNVLALRSETDSIFSIGFFSNRKLIGAVLLTILLQMAAIYLPFMQDIFKTQPLSLLELAFCFGMSILVFFGVEAIKWIRRLQSARA